MSYATDMQSHYKVIIKYLDEYLQYSKSSDSSITGLIDLLEYDEYPQLFPAMNGDNDKISSGFMQQKYSDKYNAVKIKSDSLLMSFRSAVGDVQAKRVYAQERLYYFDDVVAQEKEAARIAAEQEKNKNKNQKK